mgnify:CR=1 FL=1
MSKFTYTIFVDHLGCGTTQDVDLPQGTTTVEATAKAQEMAKSHYYHNSSIRLASYKEDDPKFVRCIWANEVAFERGHASMSK